MNEFIEVDTLTRTQQGSSVAGEMMMSRRRDGRVLVVLASGGHSGVKANVVASAIASMAINYPLHGQKMIRAAQSIINTFGGGVAAFSIIDIKSSGAVKIIEYQTPRFILFRDGVYTELSSKILSFESEEGVTHSARVTKFTAQFQDRIIFTSRGVVRAGCGTSRLGEQGWQREGVVSTLTDLIAEHPQMSAQRVSLVVMSRANMNDLFIPKNDMSCASIYLRQPRRLLICTGPPFNEKNDRLLAEKIDTWNGTKIVSGGTTAQIVARELGRDISVNMRRDISGLPPTGTMPGVDLITEGVLTLAKVKGILEKAENSEIVGKGIDYTIVRMLLSHDIVDFLVGTRINAVHQDPNLPIELELRRNVVKDIARILHEKFLKEVKVEFL